MSELLASYHFCPHCGSADFAISGIRSMRCRACGYEHFVNASGAVAAWITNRAGEVLVCRRRFMPAAGTLDLPGGFIEPGETAEEAVCREVMEETHLLVQAPRYAFSLPNSYAFSGSVIPTIDLFFRCRCSDSRPLIADDDVEGCLWMPKAHINPAAFGLHSVSRGVAMLLRQEDEENT